MPRLDRLTARINQTSSASTDKGTGETKTKRSTIPVAGTSVTVPQRVTGIYFRNAGATDIRLRINATGSDYWTITPGQITPKILVSGTTIDVASVGSDSILECLLEG